MESQRGKVKYLIMMKLNHFNQRPSTPVASLMTDYYQKEWLNQLEQTERERRKLEKVKFLSR